MAADPVYVASALSNPVSFATVNADVSGASGSFSTVVTAGAGGARVVSIIVRAVNSTAGGTILYLFHNSGGTRRNIGHIVVPANVDPAGGRTPCWEGIWFNPNADGFLASGDSIDICAHGGKTTYHAWAIGAHY